MTVFLVTLSGAKGLGSSPAARGQNDNKQGAQNDKERMAQSDIYYLLINTLYHQGLFSNAFCHSERSEGTRFFTCGSE
jgi:hypothetical protein